MRIVMFSWYYPPVVGGLENIAKFLADQLAARGHEVSVLTSAVPEGVSEFVAGRNGVPEIVRLPFLDPKEEDVAEGLRWEELESRFGSQQWDVLYGHLLTYPWAPRRSSALIRYFRERGAHILEQAQGGLWQRDSARAVELLELVDTVVSDSEYVSNSLRVFLRDFAARSDNTRPDHRAATIPEPIVIYPSIVCPAQFRPDEESRRIMRNRLGLDPDEFVVLFPSRFFDIDGSLSVQKRVPVAIEAFASFVRQHIGPSRLVAPAPPGFGSAETEELTRRKVADLTSALGIQNKTLFLEKRIPHSEMHLYYRVADVSLVPSVEAFGLVYLESMATGVPVVGVKEGASIEVVGDEGGILVEDEDDVEGLAAALVSFAKSPQLRKSTSERARSRACSHFAPERLIQRTENLLHQLLNS